MSEPIITITLAEYASLLDAADMLRCLQDAGVDNWGGYDYAMDLYDGCDNGGVN